MIPIVWTIINQIKAEKSVQSKADKRYLSTTEDLLLPTTSLLMFSYLKVQKVSNNELKGDLFEGFLIWIIFWV